MRGQAGQLAMAGVLLLALSAVAAAELIHDTQTAYQGLNDILARKKQIDDQIADLIQQLAALKRKSASLDKQFHEQCIKVQPSVVGPPTGQTGQKPAKPKTPDLAKKIQDAIKKNPHLATKLNSLDLDLDMEF